MNKLTLIFLHGIVLLLIGILLINQVEFHQYFELWMQQTLTFVYKVFGFLFCIGGLVRMDESTKE